MLISFTFENYLSFSDKHQFDLSPVQLKEHPDHLHTPYFFDKDFPLLKSVMVLGHNSAGKSNLFKAYTFFRQTVLQSFAFGNLIGSIDVDFFKLNTANEDKPTSFEVVFIIRDTRYRYMFSLQGGKVHRESLWYAEPKVRENYLFERVQNDIVISKNWSRQSEKIRASIVFTKAHHLYLSVLLSQEGIPRIDLIAQWLVSNIILYEFSENILLKKAVMILQHDDCRAVVMQFLQDADLGFKTIIDKIDNDSKQLLKLDKGFRHLLYSQELKNFELYAEHDVYDERLTWVGQTTFELLKSESSGAIKYFILSCFMAYAVRQSQLLWVDELDSKLHPLLIRHMISIFNSRINTKGGQLIYSTHNTFLLDPKFTRRDQVYLVTKNKYGASFLARMHSSKNPLRKDLAYEKQYLEGKIAGVSPKLLNKQIDLFNDPPF